MSHKVTFNISDSLSNTVGCDAVELTLFDSDFESGALSDVVAKNDSLQLASVETTYYSYTGSVQEVTLDPGAYFLEAWGAQGGVNSTSQGFGGYANGWLELTEEKTVYIYVGQHPGTSTNGGWNGGGNGHHSSYGRGGGGATDFRIDGQELTDRKLVAGGGGGNGFSSRIGGSGGGLTGGNGSHDPGFGGTQETGGAANGAFGIGGDRTGSWSSGGGGGWYGGGGGQDQLGAGGGGSSGGELLEETTSGVNSGHGYAKISKYAPEGYRISLPTSLNSYGLTAPDLKIKWLANVPNGTTLTVETAITDSDSILPAEEDWAVQVNGTSIDNLPADLTGMFLRTRAKMTIAAGSPSLEWLIVYNNADDPAAIAYIEFNNDAKAVPSTGTVDFLAVDPAEDIPYTIRIYGLNEHKGYETSWPDGYSGTVTVVDADVVENVTIPVPTSRITQLYAEVAGTPENRSARITQFYVEVAYLDEPDPDSGEDISLQLTSAIQSQLSHSQDLSATFAMNITPAIQSQLAHSLDLPALISILLKSSEQLQEAIEISAGSFIFISLNSTVQKNIVDYLEIGSSLAIIFQSFTHDQYLGFPIISRDTNVNLTDSQQNQLASELFSSIVVTLQPDNSLQIHQVSKTAIQLIAYIDIQNSVQKLSVPYADVIAIIQTFLKSSEQTQLLSDVPFVVVLGVALYSVLHAQKVQLPDMTRTVGIGIKGTNQVLTIDEPFLSVTWFVQVASALQEHEVDKIFILLPKPICVEIVAENWLKVEIKSQEWLKAEMRKIDWLNVDVEMKSCFDLYFNQPTQCGEDV